MNALKLPSFTTPLVYVPFPAQKASPNFIGLMPIPKRYLPEHFWSMERNEIRRYTDKYNIALVPLTQIAPKAMGTALYVIHRRNTELPCICAPSALVDQISVSEEFWNMKFGETRNVGAALSITCVSDDRMDTV